MTHQIVSLSAWTVLFRLETWVAKKAYKWYSCSGSNKMMDPEQHFPTAWREKYFCGGDASVERPYDKHRDGQR